VSESKISFIAQVRSSGAKGRSLILTIPKEVVDIMKLKEKDYLKASVEKIIME
jgi:hypothetical protein